MYRKIVIGYDAKESSEDAIALAQAIAGGSGSELVVTGVFPDGPFGDLDWEADFARKVEAAAERAGATAEAFPADSPARGLHDAAVELEADLLVVGASGSSPRGRLRVGNVALSLLHGAPCAVAVAPAGQRERDGTLNTIAVAIDGSASSREALAAAIALAQVTGASLRLLAVAVLTASAFGWGYGVYDLDEPIEERYQGALDEAVAQVPAGVDHEELLLDGDPAAALAEACADGVDLLCMGSRGYGPLRRVLLGSVSARVVKDAPCAILATPRGANPTGAD